MKTKPRFTIGQYVHVKATVKFQYLCEPGSEEKGPWSRQPVREECTPFVGLVVGARNRLLGEYCGASYCNTLDGYDCDPPYLNVKSCVRVWLVARSMTNLPVEVLDGDIEPANYQEWPPKCPWQTQQQPPYSDSYRKALSEDAKTMPRDAKGRFLKTTGTKP